MDKEKGGRLSRRTILKTGGTAGVLGLAGCSSSDSESDDEPSDDGSSDDDGTTTNESTVNTTEPEEDAESEKEEPEPGSINYWMQELNDHAREANVDWTQFEGDDIELEFLVNLNQYATTTHRVKDAFEELTGIAVEFDAVEEDRYWPSVREEMQDTNDEYDGFEVSLWSAGNYHNNGWVRDLTPFLEDASLTDKEWLGWPDDFLEQTIEFLTFPDQGGGESLVGFPGTVEVFGCVGYDTNTFDTLGLAEPETFAELEDAARKISESDEVDQEGIVSTASPDTLSSANWATMFRSHGAEWIDRNERESRIASAEGIKSLERFGSMLFNYGVPDAARQDWYANQVKYSGDDVGIIYGTPQNSGLLDEDRMAETKWLPPLRTEDGRQRVANTNIWAMGISDHSDHPEAVWLFIQWMNSRAANFMLSTKQWDDDIPRAGHARFEWIWDQNLYEYPEIPGEGYEAAFKKGMELVPTSPPPVPADTPQNMNIMSEAADAMSRVVANGPETARAELDAVEASITGFAEEIP